MPVKRQRSWCRPDVCGIGVVKTSFALTQVFLSFPETPDLTAIVIAVANPVTAIANRVDRGPHRGLDHPPIKLDHWLGRVEDPVTLPADGNRRCACNNRSTHGNTHAMEPCLQPGHEGRQHLQIAIFPLLLLRATRLQTISAFRRLGFSVLTMVVHSDAFAVTAKNAIPLPNATRNNLITTSLLQLLST